MNWDLSVSWTRTTWTQTQIQEHKSRNFKKKIFVAEKVSALLGASTRWHRFHRFSNHGATFSSWKFGSLHLCTAPASKFEPLCPLRSRIHWIGSDLVSDLQALNQHWWFLVLVLVSVMEPLALVVIQAEAMGLMVWVVVLVLIRNLSLVWFQLHFAIWVLLGL